MVYFHLCFKQDSLSHYQDQNVKGLKYSYINDSFKPSEVHWVEIPYENIKLLDELGSGAFGVVYKGELTQSKGDFTPCAVKALKGEQDSKGKRFQHYWTSVLGTCEHYVGYFWQLLDVVVLTSNSTATAYMVYMHAHLVCWAQQFWIRGTQRQDVQLNTVKAQVSTSINIFSVLQ